MGRKLGTEVGVNSTFVALIATKSVSIAIQWPLLPQEVGVNRQALCLNVLHCGLIQIGITDESANYMSTFDNHVVVSCIILGV